MNYISAIYQDGVFKPLESVTLPENQQVQVHIEPAAKEDPWVWFERVCARQQAIARREGTSFDSASAIAEDRQR